MKKIKWNDNTGFTYLNPQKIKYLIIHHTCSPINTTTAEDVHRWHLERGWLGIGYHYCIEGDGTIVVGRPEDAMGAHCSGGFNEFSLGVALCGDFTKENPTQKQLDSLVWLLNDILNRFPNIEIHGHKYFVNTKCPGNLNLNKILERLNKKEQSYIVSPQFKVVTELAREKGLSNVPKGWDYTQPLTEERFWALISRILRW